MKAKEFINMGRKLSPKLPARKILGLVSSKKYKDQFGKKLDSNAKFREEVCTEINKSLVEEDHKIIRYLFQQEIKSNAYGCGFSENMKRCAYMLFKLGNVEDVPLIWKAKSHSNAFCELETQFLIGAGLETTISFLQAFKDQDSSIALRYIQHYQHFGEFNSMEQFKLSMFERFDIY